MLAMRRDRERQHQHGGGERYLPADQDRREQHRSGAPDDKDGDADYGRGHDPGPDAAAIVMHDIDADVRLLWRKYLDSLNTRPAMVFHGRWIVPPFSFHDRYTSINPFSMIA